MPSSQHVRTPDSPTRHRKTMRSHSALLLPHRTSWHFSIGAAIPKSVWRLLCQFPESPHPQPWILVCRGSQGVSLSAPFPFVSSFLILYQIEGEGFFFLLLFLPVENSLLSHSCLPQDSRLNGPTAMCWVYRAASLYRGTVRN